MGDSRHGAGEDDESGPSPAALRLLGKIKDDIDTATGTAQPLDLLVALARTPAAMKVVALLVMDIARREYASAESRKNWRIATSDIQAAQADIVSALQKYMGPSAAVIFLVKLAALIGRHHGMDGAKILRLLRHFQSPEGSSSRLPPDLLLELGAQLSASGNRAASSDYDDPPDF